RESLLQYLDIRERRMAPLVERLRDGETIRLTYRDDDRFQVDSSQADVKIEEGTFPSWIVTEDSEAGALARLTFDDYVWKSKSYPPGNLPIALACIHRVEGSKESTDRVLRLGLTRSRAFPELRPGARYLLEPRFTDYNIDRVLGHLAEL